MGWYDDNNRLEKANVGAIIVWDGVVVKDYAETDIVIGATF